MTTLLQAGLVVAAAPAALAAAPQPQPQSHPKFNRDGSVAYWPGNSIICHVDKRSENFMALLDVHRTLMRSGLAHRMALLPPASYHLTIFNGVSFPERASAFPSDIAPDASETFCNEWLLAKLKAFDLGCALPLRMRALPLAQQTNLHNILFEPVDAAENRKIRGLRDRLAAALNYRLPDHDSFRFHVTLNYFYATMTPAEEQRLVALRQQCLADYLMRAPALELQNPEYVYFDDMYEFKPQLLLKESKQ